MMYDYYFRRLEKFWEKRKWWIVGVFAMIVAVGVAENLWPKSPEQKIKSALVDYHKAKGQRVRIKELSFRAVSETWTDSLRRNELMAQHEKFADRALLWNKLQRDLLPTFGQIQMLNLAKKLDGVPQDIAFEKRVDSLLQAYKYNSQLYSDSMEMTRLEIYKLDTFLDARKTAPLSFSKCSYVAQISTPNERYLDTLAAVLDEKLNVVWPFKK